jgi:hypothetical protein
MRDLSSLKKRIAELQATAAAKRSPSPYQWLNNATEEEVRQAFIDELAEPNGTCARAYGVDDLRADRAWLWALTLAELGKLWREAVYILAPIEIDQAKRDWFRSLPAQTRIDILRSGSVTATADRLYRESRVQNEGGHNGE